MSKNPFLDASEMTTSPTKDSHGTSGSGLPADIFVCVTPSFLIG